MASSITGGVQETTFLKYQANFKMKNKFEETLNPTEIFFFLMELKEWMDKCGNGGRLEHRDFLLFFQSSKSLSSGSSQLSESKGLEKE